MKKYLLVFVLAAIISLPIFAAEAPVDPGSLQTISWEEAGSDYEIIYEDIDGYYTIIKIDGKFVLVVE